MRWEGRPGDRERAGWSWTTPRAGHYGCSLDPELCDLRLQREVTTTRVMIMRAFLLGFKFWFRFRIENRIKIKTLCSVIFPGLGPRQESRRVLRGVNEVLEIMLVLAVMLITQ